jgi:hypothetical protein
VSWANADTVGTMRSGYRRRPPGHPPDPARGDYPALRSASISSHLPMAERPGMLRRFAAS